MNPLTARAIYCVGLCFLAACAVLPEPAIVAPATVSPVQPPPTVAQQLAAATRDRIEAARRYGPKHPQLIEAIAAETALREYAESVASEDDFHSQFVGALSNELAAALAQRTKASMSFGVKHPESIRAETLVRDLTITLNTEVRRRS